MDRAGLRAAGGQEAAAARAAVQAFDPEEIEHMEVLLEKIRLQLVFAE